MSRKYSTQELMIIAASREIKDREVVFVGMRLPITAFGVAKLTHAPDAVGLFECGIARSHPVREILYTMADPPNQEAAAWCSGLIQVMGLLQGGRVDAGFIGGAEIDRFGNINSSYIGDWKKPQVKLPGSGGAPDIASHSRRLIAIMNHEPRRLVERVQYITSPGNLGGTDDRKKRGLTQGGDVVLITNMAVLRSTRSERELELETVHPGHDLDEVINKTGWNLKAPNDLKTTQPPSPEEIAALHKIDTDGFWR